MSSSLLVLLGLLGDAIAVGFCLVTAFKAFSLSRALQGQAYRIRAEWTGTFSIILIGVTVMALAASLGTPGTYLTEFLSSTNQVLSYMAVVVLFAWVSSILGVAFDLDFFHRDTGHWSKARWPFWAGVVSVFPLFFLYEEFAVCVTCGSVVNYAWMVKDISLVVIGVMALYAATVLYLAGRRTPEKTMQQNLMWMGVFVVTVVLGLIATPVFPLFVAVGTYFLFRSSGHLAPAGTMEAIVIEGEESRPKRPTPSGPIRKFRAICASLVVISLALMIIILAYDGLFKMVSSFGPAGLTSSVIVYGILLVLLLTKTKLGLRLGLVCSSIILSLQALNALGTPPYMTVSAIHQYFPDGFGAYVLGFAPVHDAALCPYLCPPFAYSALVLLLLQIPLIVACYMGLRSERRRTGTN